MAMFALQGPRSKEVALKILGRDAEKIKRFHFLHSTYKDGPLWVLRTGYTGEDGYEFLAPTRNAAALWQDIMTAGESIKIQPIGFGARDTLRLEAAYRLHGQDMDETTTPLEAGLAWTVDLNKKFFIGQSALKKQKVAGLSKVLIGFSMGDRVTARHGYEIFSEGKKMGHVTGGSFAPTLNKSIGLGYVESSYAKPGKEISIKISEKAKELLIKEGFDPNLGARPLKRAIQKLLADPLAMKLLDGQIQAGEHVMADVIRGGELEFKAVPARAS